MECARHEKLFHLVAALLQSSTLTIEHIQRNDFGDNAHDHMFGSNIGRNFDTLSPRKSLFTHTLTHLQTNTHTHTHTHTHTYTHTMCIEGC